MQIPLDIFGVLQKPYPVNKHDKLKGILNQLQMSKVGAGAASMKDRLLRSVMDSDSSS